MQHFHHNYKSQMQKDQQGLCKCHEKAVPLHPIPVAPHALGEKATYKPLKHKQYDSNV